MTTSATGAAQEAQMGAGQAGLTVTTLPPAQAAAVLGGGLGALPFHEYCEQLVDVGVAREGTVFVTRPEIITTLDRILAAGHRLAPGVVVTVVAPILAALGEAARHGVQLAPEAEAVGLTRHGRPVLLLSRCERVDDATATLEAARGLLGRCRQRCPDWPAALDDAAGLQEIEAELYRAAAPRPVGDLLEAPREAMVARAPQRALPLRGGALRPLLPWRGRRGTASSVVRTDVAPARHRRPHPLDGWRRRAASAARRRRGPLTVAAAVLLGSVIATTVEAGAPSHEPGERASAPPSSAAPTEGAVAPLPPPPDAAPEAAAQALVSALSQCGGDAARCLRLLTTPDSPLRATGAPVLAEISPEGVEVAGVVADVNGASALVALRLGPDTTAASVLMIRTEAGWLIRDVFSDGRR